MKILITGGLGFVGTNIAERLSKKHEVFVIDNLMFGDRRNELEGVSSRKADFLDMEQKELDYFDVLIHCATVNINYSIENPIETFKTNALKTIELFNRFKGRIIYTSTSSVYGQAEEIPTPEEAPKLTYNAYDQSKLIAEHYLRLRGDFTTLRLSNVFGEYQRPDNDCAGVVGKFIGRILDNLPVDVYGSGKSTRDYTYVGDVVDAVEFFLEEHDSLNKEINIGGGNEMSVLELVKTLQDIIGEKVIYRYVSARAVDRIDRRVIDVSLSRTYGFESKTSMEEGLKKTVEWIKNEYK